MAHISIVVPVYKVEQYLERCVNSILAQSYTDFELILVDDGSPDNCPQMCDKLAEHDERIHVIHQKNGGLSAARNAGIDWTFTNSDSEWITFIDSDDWIHPTYLERLFYAVQKFDAQISMGEVYVTSNYETQSFTVDERKAELWDTVVAFEEEKLDPNSACARLFKRELFEKVRFPLGKLHEDRFTTYKLLFQFEKVAVVSEPLYYYFVNPEGIVHSNWSVRKLDNLEASEQQLVYFKEKGFERTYIYLLRDYIHLLVYALRNMKGKIEFTKEYKDVRNKLRKVLKEKKQLLDMNFEKDFNTYKYAYPIIAKVYRRIKTFRR